VCQFFLFPDYPFSSSVFDGLIFFQKDFPVFVVAAECDDEEGAFADGVLNHVFCVWNEQGMHR